MKSESEKPPIYKRWQFYLISFASLILSLFVILLVSVILLRWVNPSATSFTLREDWNQIEAERYNLREWWVPGDMISEHTQWAVVASEDQTFWDHSGFDLESIREAWDDRQSGRRSRGASTITQQVAKNLYLSPAQSFFRKAVEAGITVLIELFWPKERIIEVYLNIAEFGPGIFGIGKAADSFWSINASELNPEMSARLAAVLPNPKRMRAEPPSPFAQERSLWVLRQMTHLSGIAYYTPPEKTDESLDESGLTDIDPYLLRAEADMNFLLAPSEPAPSPDDTTRDTLKTAPDTLSQFDLPDSLLTLPPIDTTRINNN
jgi:monofunctional glycosyltransferase